MLHVHTLISVPCYILEMSVCVSLIDWLALISKIVPSIESQEVCSIKEQSDRKYVTIGSRCIRCLQNYVFIYLIRSPRALEAYREIRPTDTTSVAIVINVVINYFIEAKLPTVACIQLLNEAELQCEIKLN